MIDDDGADRDREVATATQSEIADGAGIDAPRLVLQLVDDLHRAQLRRAGHRTRWEAGPDRLGGRHLGTQPPPHARDELVHRLVRLDPHQIGYLDTADFANAAEVVAHEVDDRDVLCSVLRIHGQRRRQPGILRRAGGATGGALDWPGLDPSLAIDREEALGRGAEHGKVAETQVCRVWRRVGAPQGAVELERLGRALGDYGVGEADLVAVPSP